MLSIIEEFTNSLLNYCPPSRDKSKNNDSSSIDERRLKPVEERWRQTSNKRNRGHYSKRPDQSTLNDLASSLLASRNDVNANLKLPTLSPTWVNVAIGLILSTASHIENLRSNSSLPSNTEDSCPVVNAIKAFIEEWFSPITNNTTTFTFLLNNSPLLIDDFNDVSYQCKFILEKILVPFLPCALVIDKVYTCGNCQFTKKVRETINYIPVNILRTGLHLEHALLSYFAPTSSDIMCKSCRKATCRHIEVLNWPAVLLITVNDYKKNVKSRSPPNMFTLAQFSNWLSIALPSSMIYDLVSFCSILEVDSTQLLVRTTKVKKCWTTSINKRLIGNGDQLKRLFAYSRMFQYFFYNF